MMEIRIAVISIIPIVVMIVVVTVVVFVVAVISTAMVVIMIVSAARSSKNGQQTDKAKQRFHNTRVMRFNLLSTASLRTRAHAIGAKPASLIRTLLLRV